MLARNAGRTRIWPRARRQVYRWHGRQGGAAALDNLADGVGCQPGATRGHVGRTLFWRGAAAFGVVGSEAFAMSRQLSLAFFRGILLDRQRGLYRCWRSLDRIGDAGDLQRHGSPLWQLFAFGALTVSAGFWVWHGEGKHFGFGGANGRVNSGAVAASVIALLVVLILEFLVGSA